ncbi:MAG: ketopantoate reductase [Gammaproteobacteria bacterium]|jgi:2-dehydropantoate 2-reductase|nr:ketopantoate reductase [Gammaproteobacteria bacterium]
MLSLYLDCLLISKGKAYSACAQLLFRLSFESKTLPQGIIMKIAILGIGAIGGYIAASLSPINGLEIYLFARSNYNTIKNNGITLTETDGSEISLRNFFVENAMDNIPKCDIIFICVQSGQTNGLLKDLPHLCHEDSSVITLQNGLDFEAGIIQSVPNNAVYSGTCWIKVSKISENNIRHDFGNLIQLGSVSNIIADTIALMNFFKRANLELEVTDDVRSVQLTKLALNVPFFILIAKEGKTTAEILMDPSLDEKRMILQQEIIEASQKIHAPIDISFVDKIVLNLRNIKAIPPDSRKELSYRMKKELPQNAGNLIEYFADKNIELSQLKKEYTDIFKGITTC